MDVNLSPSVSKVDSTVPVLMNKRSLIDLLRDAKNKTDAGPVKFSEGEQDYVEYDDSHEEYITHGGTFLEWAPQKTYLSRMEHVIKRYDKKTDEFDAYLDRLAQTLINTDDKSQLLELDWRADYADCGIGPNDYIPPRREVFLGIDNFNRESDKLSQLFNATHSDTFAQWDEDDYTFWFNLLEGIDVTSIASINPYDPTILSYLTSSWDSDLQAICFDKKRMILGVKEEYLGFIAAWLTRYTYANVHTVPKLKVDALPYPDLPIQFGEVEIKPGDLFFSEPYMFRATREAFVEPAGRSLMRVAQTRDQYDFLVKKYGAELVIKCLYLDTHWTHYYGTQDEQGQYSYVFWTLGAQYDVMALAKAWGPLSIHEYLAISQVPTCAPLLDQMESGELFEYLRRQLAYRQVYIIDTEAVGETFSQWSILHWSSGQHWQGFKEHEFKHRFSELMVGGPIWLVKGAAREMQILGLLDRPNNYAHGWDYSGVIDLDRVINRYWTKEGAAHKHDAYKGVLQAAFILRFIYLGELYSDVSFLVKARVPWIPVNDTCERLCEVPESISLNGTVTRVMRVGRDKWMKQNYVWIRRGQPITELRGDEIPKCSNSSGPSLLRISDLRREHALAKSTLYELASMKLMFPYCRIYGEGIQIPRNTWRLTCGHCQSFEIMAKFNTPTVPPKRKNVKYHFVLFGDDILCVSVETPT